jgi:hypothetical protein
MPRVFMQQHGEILVIEIEGATIADLKDCRLAIATVNIHQSVGFYRVVCCD